MVFLHAYIHTINTYVHVFWYTSVIPSMATHGYPKFARFEALKGKGDQVKVSYNVGPPWPRNR